MKTKKKLGFSILFILVMMMGILTLSTLSMAEKKMIDNAISIDGKTESFDEIKDYGIAWNAAKKELTLDGFNQQSKDKGHGIELLVDATIILKNENKIIIKSDTTTGNAIIHNAKDLKITGPGKLEIEVNGLKDYESYGINGANEGEELIIENADITMKLNGNSRAILDFVDITFSSADINILTYNNDYSRHLVHPSNSIILKETNLRINQGGINAKKIILDKTYTKDQKQVQDGLETYLNKIDKPLVFTREPDEMTIERIAGDNRIQTAIKVSEKHYPSAKNVIIARSDNYPDSLGASVLAKQLGAPILLTRPQSLDDAVAKEIKRLGATDIYIVGGTSAVSAKVETALKEFDKDLERISGDNRYETSALIADEVVSLTGKTGKAVIASGEDFADALAIAPYAANKGQPILLVRKDTVDAKVKEAIKDNGINAVRIAGGTSRITKALEKELPTVEKRYAGTNRYLTAIEIAKDLFPGAKDIYLSRGDEFADALAIGPVAGKQNRPILLTRPEAASKELLDYIKAGNMDSITIVGGPSAVSEKVVNEIRAK